MTSSAMEIPSEIEAIIAKLASADQDTLKKYISKLQGIEEPFQSSKSTDEADADSGEEPFPPVYESGDDFEAATSFKQEAADLKADSKWEEALEKYTAAILAAEPSALLYANRAIALLKLDRPRAAERDCTLALNINPDSAKALRGRGKARKELGKWEEALKDLSAAQQIDFDENVVADLKELSELRLSHEKEEAQKRIEEEEKKKKRAEEIRKAQEDAKKEAAENQAREAAGAGGGMPGGMPGMGGMGGMPGMGGMGGMPGMGGGMGGGGGGGMPNIMQMLMSDPELAAGMQNPKVMEAFQSLLSQPGGAAGLMNNPEKIQELMSDPEVGPFLQKLMAKMGGGAMGGMPGGFGGASNPSAGNNGDDDDIDLGDLPDLE